MSPPFPESIHATSIVALGVCAVASACDVRTGRIPNALTLGAATAALPLRAWLEGSAGAWSWLAGLLGCLAPMVFLYVTAGIGGGDVKLIAAIGALKGLSFGVVAILALMAVGLLVATVRLGLRTATRIALAAWTRVLTFGLGALAGPQRPVSATPIAMAPLVTVAVALALLEERMGHPLGLAIEWRSWTL